MRCVGSDNIIIDCAMDKIAFLMEEQEPVRYICLVEVNDGQWNEDSGR